MSKILCDSIIDMDKKEFEKLGAVVLPFPYTVDGETKEFTMSSNFDYDKFYNETINKDIHVCNENVTYYISLFEKYLKKGEDIIYISYSIRINPSFNNVKSALTYLKHQYPERNIYFVDTLSVSAGSGAIIKRALIMHNNGESDEDVVRFVKNCRKNFSAYFVVSDLSRMKDAEFIEDKSQLTNNKVVSIKPVFKINDKGQIELFSRPIGMKKALNIMVDELKKLGQNVNDYTIYVMHSNSLDDANYLCEKVREYVGYEANIEIRQIGPIAGMYCKKGTVGIVFHSKSR